jgi:hypothetical protein
MSGNTTKTGDQGRRSNPATGASGTVGRRGAQRSTRRANR